MIKVGTNFLYNGERFLDERQSLATSIQDLKNWNTLVPEGFELFVGGDWYIYSEGYNDDLTGHWKRRSDYEYDRSSYKNQIETNTEDIELLKANVSLVYIEVLTGGGIFEVGDNPLPKISWKVYLGDTLLKRSEVDSATVNGSTVGMREPDPEDKYTFNFVNNSRITQDTIFRIEVVARGVKSYAEVSYNFLYKVFYGSSKSTGTIITDPIDISTLNQHWTKEYKLPSSSVSCNDEYFVFIAPSEMLTTEIEPVLKINDFRDSSYIFTRSIPARFFENLDREGNMSILRTCRKYIADFEVNII